jgi:glutamate synthase domain-containing protein 2/FAD/FMN-containing dehydrogenase/ferredoxin/glutamate synthase domain-containing protein 1
MDRLRPLPEESIERIESFLLSQTAHSRVREQQRARELLLEGSRQQTTGGQKAKYGSEIARLRDILSAASQVLLPEDVQTMIYSADTGTHMLPGILKRGLLNIRMSYIVRPGSIEDTRRFMEWANGNDIRYTIRGAATWPFGGCVPLNGDVVLDLSYLDFMHLDKENEVLAVGAGAIFPHAREYLKKQGFGLRQEITNPNSGTITGWIATGGYGLGSYKYGHVKESVRLLLAIEPDGTLKRLVPGEQAFDLFFGSEGQLGVIAAAVVAVRKDSLFTRPYAFSFDDFEDVQQFIRLLQDSGIKPTSVLYFDDPYIKEMHLIEKEHAEKRSMEALERNDAQRIAEAREDLAIIQRLENSKHVVVLEFDEAADYQAALKTRIFAGESQQRRIGDLKFHQLSTSLAHRLWNHRYLPVQMKQHGPSMLVNEMIMPVSGFSSYYKMSNRVLRRLLGIDLKTEAHLLPGQQMLIQSILLADTRTLRHKIYFALIPLMNEIALFFGALLYGTGIWNQPFLKREQQAVKARLSALKQEKGRWPGAGLINRGKFINPRGSKWMFRLHSRLTPLFNRWLVRTFHKRLQGKRFSLSYPFEVLLWKIGGLTFPMVVPPKLKAREKRAIAEIIAPCAECDSCERVCPTSDVFGLYGIATPITRRKTAERLVKGRTIEREEALGFLACTRCDNCTDACPTDIPLTRLYDLVEEDKRFQQALAMDEEEKQDFIDRFWQVMKESPLYKGHTLAEQKEARSHLQHGLKLIYPRGFEYGSLFIDPVTCIRCGMCSDENACMYAAREGNAREIPQLLDINCALCNACVNVCPQNKAAQDERSYLDRMIINATDLEEKRYWINRQNRIHDTTVVHRSTQLTEMADRYVSEDIIMEIDKESSTGQIPVSGMGQGDRHMGIGFDAERFSHFHIVGPAQNRLHEGDPEEELTIILGKREDYCKFDRQGNLVNPIHPTIKLMTPIMYNTVTLESNGRVELALIKAAQQQRSLVAIELERLLEYYDYFMKEGPYDRLPQVIMPRVDYELIDRLIVNPHVHREFLTDLWRMPVFEVEYHSGIEATLSYLRQSAATARGTAPLISGYLEVSEYDLIGPLSPTSQIKDKVNYLLAQGIDILHIHGMRNKDEYFVTSNAVRALHHYLMRIGRRHEISIIASGGIRLASDSQKTIQRGAEGTLIDFAALLALDPSTYKAIIENKATTEKLLALETDWALERLNNQAESRKVQILEVLGASGFKDIKKTVGEEGRLIDFHQIENRIQRQVFEDPSLIDTYTRVNEEMIAEEPVEAGSVRNYTQLTKHLVPLEPPHDFYRLGETNQTLYKRDFVWPGPLIETMGRMAAADPALLDFNNIRPTGLLGDGFDVMKILYNKDPMDVPDRQLDDVKTALPLDKGLVLEAPWMFGGKSVGSIGLDSWKAHVTAARRLGIQVDTGEGGYPTGFFLNSKGEPVFFTENQFNLLRPLFESGKTYTIGQIRSTLKDHHITETSHPDIYEKIKHYPSLKPFYFMVVVDKEDESFVSTELKTGLFGVTKESIRKARRVVIAYSQGAKMGIGGHILAQKVNKLVSYLRGIEGLETLNMQEVELLFERLKKIVRKPDHPLKDTAEQGMKALNEIQNREKMNDLEALKEELLHIQERVYELFTEKKIDEIDHENIIRSCESILNYSYTSIISPFPFHNCYSIEDVKAFIDVVHMINPCAVISIKVSPSIDIEFIAAGLARISKDNTDEVTRAKYGDAARGERKDAIKAYARDYGMKLEIWLDGPRGGTGASPNIIKGQMGMHIEYAIPLIHNRLVRDGLRNYVKFIVSGGIRTYEDVIKSVALGADGVIWGTAPMVAIGCDRNRNCHDGCSRGIATSNLTMQKLRDVEKNTQQIINAFTMMQMQVIRALAAMGLKDIRELRGRFDKIHWIGLKERVDHRFRVNREIEKEIAKDEELYMERMERATGQSNCGVAAINGSVPIPGIVLDEGLNAMRNRGMDGVGIAKTLCFPEHAEEYAFRVMVKGVWQKDIETRLESLWQKEKRSFTKDQLRSESRRITIELRSELMAKIKTVFLDPYFDFYNENPDPGMVREPYKTDNSGNEKDYRTWGSDDTDPGDIYCFFVRVKTNALFTYIENSLFKYDWERFFVHRYPEVTRENYKKNRDFLENAEDIFVFHHATILTRILYVSDVAEGMDTDNGSDEQTGLKSPDREKKDAEHIDIYDLKRLKMYIQAYPYAHNKHRYVERRHKEEKLAAVMSSGKNFAVWKTAGREIPWQTPDAPNNIIHVRLATGSVVEQMNAHPFTKLHTALTHNGETTNYEALKQRVEQFHLSPLATTDTEVAALKFHLTAEEWGYPDWALFESFSPTTGDDLHLVDENLRHQLEQVQRVEFTSSPDGPYQYLCLRHDPNKRVTERVDLKDPADLRPNVTAFWKDDSGEQKRVFSLIASEEQAIHTMLRTLDSLGIIDGAAADSTITSTGMISRYFFDKTNHIYDCEFVDRYGKPIVVDPGGEHYSVRRNKVEEPKDKDTFKDWDSDYRSFFNKNLAVLDFNSFRWLLDCLVNDTENDDSFAHSLEVLTWLKDYLPTLEPGEKAQSSLIDICQFYIDTLLARAGEERFEQYVHTDRQSAAGFDIAPVDSAQEQTLVIDANRFLAEGCDPELSLAAFLSRAYALGWRRFILYKTRGQRLISTAVMGNSDTDDVEMDVYGSAGEYFGAFMQGGTIRLHGSAQNFCAMGMHHGFLYIYGNAGKVNGYASKGGRVFIMGNVVDRGWANSVNDSRCQDLEVFILGSATKYTGESLMGGNFFFGGLHFNNKGELCFNERPHLGTKMLGGASRGKFVFFDPQNRLLEPQYVHGKIKEFEDDEWNYFIGRIKETFQLSNIPVIQENGSEFIRVEGKNIELNRAAFKMIVPKGGLKGYDSH